MKSTVTLEEKQNYLRSQIIDAGVDPQSFMVFMGAYKGEGEDINLEKWSLPQLKQVVKQFKLSLQQELRSLQQIHKSKLSAAEALAKNRASRIVADRVMGSNLPKKEKVFYDRDDLWDFEIKSKQQCKKTHQFFNFKVFPEISCKGVQIKKTGGFFFGIGAKHFIQMVIYSNFASNTITRKSQDADWLRTVLFSQYPGTYIPPLDETPVFQPQDKTIAYKRARQIISFLNSLVHYDHLINNKFTHMYFTESDPKAFETFKSKNTQIPYINDSKKVENLQGFFSIEISQRILQFVKNTSKYSKQVSEIYKNIQINMVKLQSDLQSVAKHSQLLSVQFGKLREKYVTMSQKCNIHENPYNNEFDKKFGNVLGHLKSVFANLQAHSRKQSVYIREVTEEQVKYQNKQWSQFEKFERRYRGELDTYLTFKLSFSRKKQQFFLDTSKRQLEEKQRTGVSKQTTLNQKEQTYKASFPYENRMDQQKKMWIGYINHMYEKSFIQLLNEQEKQIERKMKKIYSSVCKMLNERIQLYNGLEKYLNDEGNKNDGEIQMNKILK